MRDITEKSLAPTAKFHAAVFEDRNGVTSRLYKQIRLRLRWAGSAKPCSCKAIKHMPGEAEVSEVVRRARTG